MRGWMRRERGFLYVCVVLAVKSFQNNFIILEAAYTATAIKTLVIATANYVIITHEYQKPRKIIYIYFHEYINIYIYI